MSEADQPDEQQDAPGGDGEAVAATAVVAAEAVPDVAPAQPPATLAASSHEVVRWPFLAYLAIWVTFAGTTVWRLLQVPSSVPMYDSEVYPYTVLAGLVLTFAGPALIMVVWLGSLTGEAGKGARFVNALVKGSVATTIGVLIWWASIVALDAVRLGRPF